MNSARVAARDGEGGGDDGGRRDGEAERVRVEAELARPPLGEEEAVEVGVVGESGNNTARLIPRHTPMQIQLVHIPTKFVTVLKRDGPEEVAENGRVFGFDESVWIEKILI